MPSNRNRHQLLQRLIDGEFHSGSTLADAMGISRTAVNNHIQALQELGLDIYSVKGKGYRLARSITLLDAEAIDGGSGRVFLLDDVNSTNSYLLDRVAQLNSGDCCLAERQTQGRGRRGRQWVSPYAGSLYLSMYWRLEHGVAQSAGLSLAVGVLLVEALESLGIAGVGLKWPNDLYVGPSKLAGILVEMRGQFGEPADMVLGCGMNVSLGAQAAAGIDRAWTDLASHCGDDVDRNRLASAVIAHLQAGLRQFEAEGLAGFLPRWQKYDLFWDREVNIHLGERVISGRAVGIDEQGALLLESSEGLKSYNSGEVSLRPTV
ncbi:MULTISPECIES: bifunctional biotin--[acetyl-CoA-carboxylase] ligase/biotin operon repressor BirA [Ferrimonas]|uniref:bifunctional biotin--[acetyl-CoA-carboxylase] ligase/biotin operon repressor BirA n=1 Tax=Ferrimonas TaxID=44011 RepID=UPI000480E831|nr:MULTISPECIES: bifunctional biotin--[acetyl-CoA-carboxylase] ligase/biotin operon repressor BirA [Ferrimonas]USD37821.1 bifunctional biotin--[acetyl-CoA-carboxylase] synthetase/biotin operon repressor [Ferrimonas sp. SCSIO 43195]